MNEMVFCLMFFMMLFLMFQRRPTPPESGVKPVTPESIGRTTRIFAGAFIMLVVMCACVFYFFGFFVPNVEPAKSPMLAVIRVGATVMLITLGFIMPTVLVNIAKARLKDVADADLMAYLAAIYQGKTLVRLGSLTGAAFVNVFDFILEKQFWSYGVVAFLLGVMAISFPSQGQFENWAEDMQRELN